MRAQFIYEKLDFERGQEPFDSLAIGRVKEREEAAIYGKIKRAMMEIMDTLKLPISGLKDFTTKDRIDFRFHYEIWDYCIQYDKNFTDPVFDYTYHVAYFGSPGMENSDILDYGTLEQCIDKLNYWLKLSESLDFERGQKPLKSMEIGVYAKYGKFYDLFIELHEISKASPNFKEVSEIFWDKEEQPYFDIKSQLMGWQSVTKESVPEQFVISLYKIYIACYMVLSGDEVVIASVNKFDQITRCLDEG